MAFGRAHTRHSTTGNRMAARTAVGVEVEYRHHRGRVSLSLSLCVERRVARETYVVSVRGAGVLITATLTIIIYGLYNTILDIYIVYRALRVRLAPVLFTERYNTIKHNPFPYSRTRGTRLRVPDLPALLPVPPAHGHACSDLQFTLYSLNTYSKFTSSLAHCSFHPRVLNSWSAGAGERK